MPNVFIKNTVIPIMILYYATLLMKSSENLMMGNISHYNHFFVTFDCGLDVFTVDEMFEFLKMLKSHGHGDKVICIGTNDNLYSRMIAPKKLEIQDEIIKIHTITWNDFGRIQSGGKEESFIEKIMKEKHKYE